MIEVAGITVALMPSDPYQLIQTGGIAAVLAFVLIRLEARLADNTKAINELTLKIGLLLDRNDRTLKDVATRIERHTVSHPNNP